MHAGIIGAVGRWIVAGGGLVAAGVLAWLLAHRDTATPPPRPHREPLDVEAFRAELSARLDHARHLVPPPKPPAPPTRRWPDQGRGAIPGMGTYDLAPCLLGPAEMCAALTPLVTGCDDGDASDCLAVGQFLVDTPPRPLIARTYFIQACRIGDPTGCERADELDPKSGLSCEQNAVACTLRGLVTHNPELLEDACTRGVADACSILSSFVEGDVDRARGLLARSCQLGFPLACLALGKRLSADCVTTESIPCFPPDPDQATAALAIARAAGWSP